MQNTGKHVHGHILSADLLIKYSNKRLMKKLIFVIVVFACGLSQCKKSGDASKTISDENLVSSTGDDNSKDTVKGIVPLDTTRTDPMSVDPNDSTALVFIRMFYKEYLLEFENDFVDSVRRKYCTPELIKKIVNKELDYDPFLNAQDFDDSLLRTLDAKKSNTPQGYYIVSYVDGYSKKKVYIVISLAEHEGEYRISDVIFGFEPDEELSQV